MNGTDKASDPMWGHYDFVDHGYDNRQRAPETDVRVLGDYQSIEEERMTGSRMLGVPAPKASMGAWPVPYTPIPSGASAVGAWPVTYTPIAMGAEDKKKRMTTGQVIGISVGIFAILGGLAYLAWMAQDRLAGE